MITKDRLNKSVKGESLQRKPQADPKVVENSSRSLAAIARLQKQLEGIELITPEIYIQIDHIRDEAEKEMAWWDSQTEPITKPLRSALDATYALSRTVKRPLENISTACRTKMENYKLQEAKQIRAAQEEEERKAQEIQDNIDKLKEQKANAATPQMRGRIDKKINELQGKSWDEKDEVHIPDPVRAEGSTARYGYDWQLDSIKEVARAVVDGKIPEEAIIIDAKWMNAYFKANPAEVMEWPGVKVVDAVSIIKKSESRA